MRIASSLIVLAAVVFGAFALAGADDDTMSPEDVTKRIEALEMQVKFLRLREQALTMYILQNDQRAAGIEDIARRSREAGFEKNRIPEASRTILLKGFDEMAASLRKDLPQFDKEQQALFKKIRAAEKQLGN